tara:strand:- start:493 stop:1557 length:1065 start_codon:yes stop_codon:yes gene_type:complete
MYSFIQSGNQYLNNINNDQGKQLLSFNDKHLENIDVSRILETCDKSVCSIRETMDQGDSTNVNVTYNELLKEVKEKENKFNNKLKEYTDLQKTLNEELIRKNEFYKKNKSFLGKTVSNHDTNYYINNFGYTHTYTHEAWDNDHDSCSSTAKPIKSRQLSQFTKSVDMNSGQPCHIAGQMIQNKKTREYAWVDLKGIKHIYASDIWGIKHKTCKTKIKKLSNDDFKAIPLGSNMKRYTPCMKLDINPRDYIKLREINKELIYLAKDISKSMNKVISKDQTINNKINNKKHKLESYLKDLDNNRDMIDEYTKSIVTISAQEEDASKESTAEYYMYISWTLVAILIGSITIKTLSKN